MASAEDQGIAYKALSAGDPAPRFHQRSPSNENYVFDAAAGRYLVLCFYMSGALPAAQEALRHVEVNRALFDDENIALFGVTVDPADEAQKRVANNLPGIRHFWDFDHRISRLYGALPANPEGPNATRARLLWVVIDPTLRILRIEPLGPEGNARLFDYLKSLPPPHRFAGMELQAPILVLPHVFEPEFCRQLIGLYDAGGGEESGFMRDVGGKTVGISDAGHKRRRDYVIEDPAVMRETQTRIYRRIRPEIARIYSFEATRMERYIVGCYTAEDGGHFRAHRDNTTRGTAHRRFAVSINLNQEFEGGEVSFPEYSPRGFKPPVGGAVIFPCALLHAVSRVTSGRRYAFLPFLYDDAAAKIREANSQYLENGTYKADQEAEARAVSFSQIA